MHILKVFFVILLLSTLHLSAEGVVPSPIYGSVNVITGQFVEEVSQIVLHSPFELGLVRAYIGPDKENKPLVCWSMGASYLTFHQEESNHAFPSSFVVDEPSGSRTIYNWDQGRWVADLKGLSNQSGVPLHNATFDRFQEKDGQTSFRMERGDEESLIFCGKTGRRCLPLQCVERLSGESVEIEYEESGALDVRSPPKRMTLRSPSGQELGWIRYCYQAEGDYSLLASDGQRVDYKVECGGRCLKEVVRPGWPTISYDYSTSTHSHYTKPEQKGLVRLARRQEGELFIENSYYEASHKTKGAKLDKERVQHPLVNCVKQQFANVGERKEDRVCVANYTYHFDPKKDYAPGEVSGWTDVVDASGNRTRYTWDKGQRITSIERYQGQSGLLVRESYSFDDHHGWGWLTLGKVISDAQAPVMAVTSEQDPSGNILSETIWGDLTGCSGPLELDANGFPKWRGVDSLCHAYQYLSGGRLEEERVGALRKVYSYLGESDLISSIALFGGEELIEQIAFEYDQNGAVTRQERRSGSQLFTTKIEPVQEGPAIGFPRRIEEYAGGQLLGAVEYTYGLYNLPTSETYFDANNVPRYTLYTEYDEGGRPIRTTDPMGHATTLEYDEMGRLKSTVGALQEKTT